MSLIKCPKCNKEFINTNSKCLYCGYDLSSDNSDDNDNFILNGNALVKYQGTRKNVVIPNSVIEISKKAFMDNHFIETVEFSDNNRIIDESAFENCINLKRIINNSKITHYKKNCFKNCGLIDLEISNNTMEIGECAFFENEKLETLNYHPNKNLSLKRSFAKCSKLSNVTVDQKYFYPSFGPNERGDGRPTYFDVFWNTPYMRKMFEECRISYKKKICIDCGGRIKGIFNKKCSECNIYYRRFL